MVHIKDVAKERAIKVNKIELFFNKDALDFIEKCIDLNICIYGLDAFKLDGNGMQPFLEYSADYSGLEKEKSWAMAREHLKTEKNKIFLFEIIYEGY